MYRLTLFFVFLFFLNVYPQSHKDYISGPFDSPQALTQECLNCHQNAAIELMKTNHWTWLDEEYVSEDGNKTRMGKKNFINNFCIAVPSNYPRSEEHTSELQSREKLVCRLLLEKKK